jgi:hypothetical protein
MKFTSFESLGKDEAAALLDDFLRTGMDRTENFASAARQQGIEANFDVNTLPAVMRWVLAQVRTVPTAADPTVPEWIAETDVYKRGLFKFGDESAPPVLQAAYYFGECFVRSFVGLGWSIGDIETAQQNMPVVAGFDHQMELAPILVTQNVFRRILAGEANETAIDRAVDRWIGFLTPRA